MSDRQETVGNRALPCLPGGIQIRQYSIHHCIRQPQALTRETVEPVRARQFTFLPIQRQGAYQHAAVTNPVKDQVLFVGWFPHRQEGRKNRSLKHKKIEKHPIFMSYAMTVKFFHESTERSLIDTTAPCYRQTARWSARRCANRAGRRTSVGRSSPGSRRGRRRSRRPRGWSPWSDVPDR